jgi:acyl-CoA synthetase (AMP-forming)/AMP-acid ligase II
MARVKYEDANMSTPDTNERIVGYRTAAEDFLGTAKEDLSANESVYISRLVASLADAGSQTILRYRNEDVTANELLESIYRYARALATLGIGRGSLVALFAPNCPDAIAVRYAANLIASAAVYLPLPATSPRRAELVAQMAPDLLVVFPQTTGLVPAGTSARIASVGVSVAGASVRLDDIASEQGSEAFPCAARPADLAIVLSSGGTTGVPKGSRRNFMAYSAMVNLPSSPDRRQLVNGHFAYLSQVLVDVTLLGGGCVVLRDAYDAADTLATIESERITDLFLVEPQLFEVMDHPDVSRRDLSSLRTLNHMGASAPPTLRIRAQERLGPVIAHTYGASEEGVVSMLTPAEHDPLRRDRFTCAGRILPGVEVRLRRENGSLAEIGEVGSIEVRSPAMAQGYRNRPELEAEDFRDGWYRPRDLGRIDDEGYLHILGRAADVRWIAGTMLSPTLVEETLCQMPAVRVAVVVAHNEAGTWIGAVVPWEGVSIDPQACLTTIAEEHGPEAAAPFVVIAMRNIPVTEQGKPDREAIKQLARGHALAHRSNK